jgi:hypothetical protein
MDLFAPKLTHLVVTDMLLRKTPAVGLVGHDCWNMARAQRNALADLTFVNSQGPGATIAQDRYHRQTELVSNESGGWRLNAWRPQITRLLATDTLCEREQESLRELLQILSNLRPYLVQGHVW